MATAFDFTAERERLDSRLGQVDSRLAQLKLAELTGEGDIEERDRLRDEAAELRRQLAELGGAQSLDQANRERQARDEDARRLKAEALRLCELLRARKAHAKAATKSARSLRASLTQLDEVDRELEILWVTRAKGSTEQRRLDRIEAIRRLLGQSLIRAWKQSIAVWAGLLPPSAAVPGDSARASQDLGDYVSNQEPVVREQAKREFGHLEG